MIPDLRYAFRQLTKSPGFTVVAVLTLAIGIGANTALFSIVNATFLRSLPYPEPGRLMHVTERNRQWPDMSVSYPNFLDWVAQQEVFTDLAIYRTNSVKLKTAGASELVSAGYVSAGFFDVLGVNVALGRALAPEDDRPGAAPVVWLTHAGWQRFFSGDPAAIGQSVLIEGRAYAVAGILPPDFRFFRAAELFLPVAPAADEMFLKDRENHNGTRVVARLKPGESLESAQAAMDVIAQRLQLAWPEANAGIGIRVQPLRDNLASEARSSQLLLLGAVGLVLLIACVNVANMLLARSLAREREIAVRTALGASRFRLVRLLVTESLLIAAVGGAVGALLSLWGYDFGRRLVPWQMQPIVATQSGYDANVLFFLAGITVLTGLFFGLVPAWHASRIDPNDALKNTPRTLRLLPGHWQVGDLLVVGQVALALVLLVAASLMVRSLQRLTAISPGVDPTRVITLQVAPPAVSELQRDAWSHTRFQERILAEVATLPEVESAAFGSALPFSWNTSSMVIFRTDLPVPEAGKLPSANSHFVTTDYFRVMGIPVLRGRAFTGREPQPEIAPNTPISVETIARVYRGLELDCVVSERMAESLWPGEDPIGRRFQLGFPSANLPVARVVGIVGNTRQETLDRDPKPEFYLALHQFPAPFGVHLAVRTRLEPSAAVAAVQKAIRAVAPDHPIHDVRLMSDRVADSYSGRRFNMSLFAFFGGTALLLAVIGIYGVLAFNVGRRTREIGIRMALGAQRHSVLLVVLRRGLTLVLPGIALGLAGGWFATRLLQSQLFGVGAFDLTSYIAGALALLLAAGAACWIPARRATRVDPIEALRTE
ncbi:MAG TPA: ABC transporter permease [Opitutus sp.]|nr:ABC transporter permease [Opitutus sp.]